MGKDLLIRANSDYKSISKSLANKYLVLFAVFFTFGLFVFLFRIQFQNTSLIELFGAIISWGTLSGFVLLIYGHALIHKDNPYLRLMGRGLFFWINYPQFPFTHRFGHHKFNASEGDFDTAKRGESYYLFFVRGCVEEYRFYFNHYWKQKKNGRKIFIVEQVSRAIYLALVFLLVGLKGLFVLIGISLIARIIIEMANYLQHYDIQRMGPRVSVDHSWDLTHRSANLLLMNAGFHGEHHIHSYKDDQGLDKELSPNYFPYNYPIMLALCFFPSLLKQVMSLK
jgi:alkane 1-monooxygenase